jgi:hypothetical protein
MANSLTNLIATIYDALDIVSRELVGFIPAVGRDSKAEQAAVNQTVRSPVVPAAVAADIVPSNVSATGADRSINFVDMILSKARKVSFNLTGEQGISLGVNNASIARDSFSQAFRTLTNEMESDLAATYVASSRAFGTAGTAPFGNAGDLSDFANTTKILDDNGAPRSGRQLVLGTTAMANLRGKQSVLFKVNEAGTDDLLRNGIVGRVQGFDLHDSAQVKSPTKGTGASYTSDAAGYAVGATTINLITGTGTVLAGDVVTFAGDTNRYVVATGVAAPGAITLAAPGLRQAIPTAATALTVGGSYTANMAFTKNALVLATRLPAVPQGGDDADDRIVIQDPVSGLAFEVAVYRQYRQVSVEAGIVWGVKAVKPEHMAILLG